MRSHRLSQAAAAGGGGGDVGDHTLALSPIFYSGAGAGTTGTDTSASAVEELLRMLRGGSASSEGVLGLAARSQTLFIPIVLLPGASSPCGPCRLWQRRKLGAHGSLA
jgi:hypothetical protein